MQELKDNQVQLSLTLFGLGFGSIDVTVLVIEIYEMYGSLSTEFWQVAWIFHNLPKNVTTLANTKRKKVLVN